MASGGEKVMMAQRDNPGMPRTQATDHRGGIILEKSSRFRRPSPPVFALIRYTNA